MTKRNVIEVVPEKENGFEPITRDEVATMLGSYARGVRLDEITERINQALMAKNMDDIEFIRSNIIGLMDVIKTGTYTVEEYVNAVTYCSYKLMGDSNVDAYRKTFPERYARLEQKYREKYYDDKKMMDKRIAAFVSAYNRGKLVTQIMSQSLVPAHLMYAPLYHEAIGEMASLMKGAKSEMVRYNAANSLIEKLAPPEETKIKLDVTTRSADEVDMLRETIRELAMNQARSIEKGLMDAKQVAEKSLHISE